MDHPVNQHFIGREIGVVNADKFTYQHIPQEVIAEDRDLMDKKYWDYKMWHPMVATMYFVHRYHTIAAHIIAREVGEEEAKRYRGMASRYDLRNQSLAIQRAWWKARMAADTIGCSYEVYIRAAIRNFRANIKLQASRQTNKRQQLPYPQQLVNGFVAEQALKDWAQDKKARFPMPQSEDLPNNPNIWFQDDMESWIREEAKRTENPSHHIKKAQSLGLIVPGTSQAML